MELLRLLHLDTADAADGEPAPARAFAEVHEQFNDKELSALTFRVMGINGWNRVNVAYRTTPGAQDRALGLDKAGLA